MKIVLLQIDIIRVRSRGNNYFLLALKETGPAERRCLPIKTYQTISFLIHLKDWFDLTHQIIQKHICTSEKRISQPRDAVCLSKHIKPFPFLSAKVKRDSIREYHLKILLTLQMVQNHVCMSAKQLVSIDYDCIYEISKLPCYVFCPCMLTNRNPNINELSWAIN